MARYKHSWFRHKIKYIYIYVGVYIYILRLQIVKTSINRNQIFNSGLARRDPRSVTCSGVICDKKSSLLILPSRLYLEGYRARSCIVSENSKHTEKSPKQPPFSLLEALEKDKNLSLYCSHCFLRASQEFCRIRQGAGLNT